MTYETLPDVTPLTSAPVSSKFALLHPHQPTIPQAIPQTLQHVLSQGSGMVVPSVWNILHPDIYMANFLTSCKSLLNTVLSLRLALITLYKLHHTSCPHPLQAS